MYCGIVARYISDFQLTHCCTFEDDTFFYPPCWLKAAKARSLEPHSRILGHRLLSPILKWPNRIRKRSASVSPGPRTSTQCLTKHLRCTLWLHQLEFSHLLEGLLDIPCKTCWCDRKSAFEKNPVISCLWSSFVTQLANAGECRLWRLSPEVYLFCRIVVEQ